MFKFLSFKNQIIMINYKLPGLHKIQDSNSAIAEKYKDYTLIKEFISDTTLFYKRHFHELNDFILREKRSLIFETPNRVKICHEYDLFQKKNKVIKSNRPYFIINPTERLAWLKIFNNGERVTIARADVIKDILVKKLELEIELYCNLTNVSKKIAIEEIWNAKKGLPCFIIFSQNPKQSFMLEMEFYEAVVLQDNKKSRYYLTYPIQTQKISYDYIPLSNQTSWLYLQSPKNFELKLYENDQNIKIGSDPEVVSYAFIDACEHNFSININIAKTLKIWYLSIYYSSLMLIILILSIDANRLWNKLELPTLNLEGIETYLQKESLVTIATLISAGIITTRSFMITEETILKKYSKHISIFLVLIVVLSIFMIMLSNS